MCEKSSPDWEFIACVSFFSGLSIIPLTGILVIMDLINVTFGNYLVLFGFFLIILAFAFLMISVIAKNP